MRTPVNVKFSVEEASYCYLVFISYASEKWSLAVLNVFLYILMLITRTDTLFSVLTELFHSLEILINSSLINQMVRIYSRPSKQPVLSK